MESKPPTSQNLCLEIIKQAAVTADTSLVTSTYSDVILSLFYATPIIYPLAIMPKSLIKLVSISPLAQIFQDMRYLMITNKTTTTEQVFHSIAGLLIPLAVILIIGFVAVWYFRKSSPKFAEDL